MFKSVFKSGIRAAYDVANNPTLVAEPWYVYPAKHYSSGRVVSVFIFDKSKFEAAITKLCQNMSNTSHPKAIVSECYELLRLEVGQMAKLKHPQLLTVYENLEETKTKFLFVTEAVANNLLTVNLESLDDLSIQKGLLEICKSIQFLHNYCSIVHLNIQPSSIFINQQGDWKLAGFRFLKNLNEISAAERENHYIMNNSSLVPFANYNVNFTPPELIIDSHANLDLKNDIWSLACLIFYIFNNGEHLIDCFDSSSVADFKTAFKKFETKFYNHRVSDLKYVLKNVPEKLYVLFPRLMARVATERMSIDQLIDSDYFNGSLIKAMWFIDEFSTKSLQDKLVFLRGLLDEATGPSLLEQLPTQYKNAKLLPLMTELLKTELNVPLVVNEPGSDDRVEYVCITLSIVLRIGKGLSQLTFQDRIYDTLLSKTKTRKKEKGNDYEKLINFSVKVRLTIVENLEILESKLKDSQFAELIKGSVELFLTLPSNELAYKQEQTRLQDQFFAKTHLFAKKFDFPYIKNTFFPLLCQVFKTTTILSTKVATINVFEHFVDDRICDQLIVKEQLLPIFQNLKSRDKRIVENALRLFVKLSKSAHISLDLDTVVDSILPICLKLVYGCNECTKIEFKTYMKSISEIQEDLTARKLAVLPESVPSRTAEAQGASFETLVNSQKFNDGNLDKLQIAPHAKTIKPARREEVLQPKKITPLTLKPKPGPTPRSAVNLVNGPSPTNQVRSPINLSNYNGNTSTFISQTSSHTSSVTQKSASTGFDTSSSWLDTNEFADFQSAPAQVSTWNVSTSANNSPAANMTLDNTPIKSPPPGFNASILTPTTRATQNKNTLNII